MRNDKEKCHDREKVRKGANEKINVTRVKDEGREWTEEEWKSVEKVNGESDEKARERERERDRGKENGNE
jgi:hypothetical protein